MGENYKGYQISKNGWEANFQIAIINGLFWFWLNAGDKNYSQKLIKLPFVHNLQNAHFLLNDGRELTPKENGSK